MISDLAAIAVAHRGEKVCPVKASLQRDLGDPREFVAENVSVARHRRAEAMEVDLLKEVPVLGWTLVAPGITRVVEASTVRCPFEASATRRIVHARNFIGESLAGGDVVHIRRAVLAAVLRERHEHAL